MAKKERNSRDEILEATLRVMIREGFSGVTMDAVARESGLSKGGVFHHFSSKEELFSGFLEFSTQRALKVVRSQKEHLPSKEAAQTIRAMIATAFPEAVGKATGDRTDAGLLHAHRDFILGIMAVGGLNRDLLGPLRDLRDGLCKEMLAEGEIGVEEILLWLSMDGLWMWRMIGLIDEDDALWGTLAKALVQRAERLGMTGAGGKER